jgi:predicted dehydrogenase
MITAAVVGLGRIGFGFELDPLRLGAVTHAGAWSRHPATKLVAGIDPSPVQREQFEKHFNVPAYESLEDMFDVAVPDALSVATPAAAHRANVVAAVAAGVNRILCEKPCTPDVASARGLLADLGNDSRRVGVNYTRRYDPLHRHLLGRIRAGEVRSMHGRYTAGIRNTASHWLDCLFASGATVRRVLAVSAVDGDDPSPTLVLDLGGGATATLHGLDVADYLVFESDVVGRTAGARLTHSGSSGAPLEVVSSPMYSGYREMRPMAVAPPLGLSNPMLSVIDDVVAAIDEDRPMLCSVRDALAVHEVIEGALQSLASGEWVEVGAV